MKINLAEFINKNETVAVALSGGSDSMALLHYMHKNAKDYGFNVIAINVEHGIRGEQSKKDTEFVKNYCDNLGVELICYSVDCIAYSKKQKLSLEEGARKLRYDCFFNAITNGKCSKIATAHHLRDNVESILLNLFRGTGLKGLAGITSDYDGKIIRPFINVTKEEIERYVLENSIPFVTDESNFSDEYSRNFIRLNVLPKICEIFPDAEKSITRLSSIVKLEDDFLDKLAIKSLTIKNNYAIIPIDLERAIFNRAVILALKKLGVSKDWQKIHVDDVYKLCRLQNGAQIILPKHFTATKEYDKIIISQIANDKFSEVPFSLGKLDFNNNFLIIETVKSPVDLKDGLYLDLDKIPKTAVIRTKKDNDLFVKFGGGGTKKLNDYLTDVKVPLRLRSALPVLADGDKILAIFGVAISEKVKVDGSTVNIIKITKEELK